MGVCLNELQAFRDAKEMVETGGDPASGIAALIDLSFNSTNLTLRRWAQQFLNTTYNVTFMECDNAPTTKAGDLPR